MRIDTHTFGGPPRSRAGDLRLAILGVIVVVGTLVVFGYLRARDLDVAAAGSAAERLQPVTRFQDTTIRGTVYVPVYSSLYGSGSV
jgi:hypothetical protein